MLALCNGLLLAEEDLYTLKDGDRDILVLSQQSTVAWF